jgi:hypothetical protein
MLRTTFFAVIREAGADPALARPGVAALLDFAGELRAVLTVTHREKVNALGPALTDAVNSRKDLDLDDVATAVRLWLTGPVLLDTSGTRGEYLLSAFRRIAWLQRNLAEGGLGLDQRDTEWNLIDQIRLAGVYGSPRTVDDAVTFIARLLSENTEDAPATFAEPLVDDTTSVSSSAVTGFVSWEWECITLDHHVSAASALRLVRGRVRTRASCAAGHRGRPGPVTMFPACRGRCG